MWRTSGVPSSRYPDAIDLTPRFNAQSMIKAKAILFAIFDMILHDVKKIKFVDLY